MADHGVSADARTPADELFARLGSDCRATQRNASQELLRRIPADAALRDRLRELLRKGSPRARFAAAFVLAHAERPSLRLLPALLDSLELPDGDLRWQAAHLLADLARLHGEATSVVLHEARCAPSPLRRRMAIYLLREIAPEREESVRICLEALADPDPEIRHAALTCFGKLHAIDGPAFDRIVDVARSHTDVRMRRIATAVLPQLVRILPEREPDVRAVARELANSDDPSIARAARAIESRTPVEIAES